jgi:hypothetical protein
LTAAVDGRRVKNRQDSGVIAVWPNAALTQEDALLKVKVRWSAWNGSAAILSMAL